MKRTYLIVGLLFFFYSTKAQDDFIGAWQGKLNIGAGLRIVFHINKNEAGIISSTMDSPDQYAFGLACDSTIVDKTDVRIVLTKAMLAYSGKLSGNENIEGTLSQKGMNMPLNLKRLKDTTQQTLIRPQTPVPPFPYKSIDVEYDNTGKTLHYGATITKPDGDGPFPAIVMITGSGRQDRDETIFGHKSFAVIADHLTRNGFIVMRVDDRGAGKSTGDFANSTTADFVQDVNTSINYLKTIDGVDKNKIGLIGHSEGGMIAPMVATQRNDINFIVLLAGPGVKITELMTEQNAAMYKAGGVNEEAVITFKPVYTEVVNRIITAADTTDAYKDAYTFFDDWANHTASKTLRQLEFDTEEKRMKYMHAMVGMYYSPWFRYFMVFDPTPYLQKLHCKVLALNGSRDIQVIASQNLPGIEAALKKAGAKDYEIKELPGLNHLFQTCKQCNASEYGKLEETFSPAALDIITDWLNKNVK